MKTRLIGAIFITLLLLTTLGCSALTPITGPAQEQTLGDPTQVLSDNLAASNAEDVTAYMQTLHPDSPAYAQTQTTLEKLNYDYDLRYTLTDVRIDTQTTSEARIYGLLTTRKIRGGDFVNNRVQAIFIMRPYEGKWRLYGQEIINLEYLGE